MSQGPSKRLRRSSRKSQIQPQVTSDGELGAPSESSAAAATTTMASPDTIPSEPPQTPNHGMPPWVLAGVTRSPSSVTGNQLQVGGDFGCIARNNGLIVDKTRLCKALFDCKVEAICVCLPRRFGKTFNLSIVEEFFNVVTNNDIKPVDGSIDIEAGRAERMKLFEKSLLLTTESEFFNEHFCRYPVIRINFKEVTASSPGGFYKSLSRSLYSTLAEWLKRLEGVILSAGAHNIRQSTAEYCRSMKCKLGEDAVHWDSRDDTPKYIFMRLSDLLSAVYDSPYIVLFDEYDIPLKVIRGNSWEQAAAETYLSLINRIFKDNRYLKSGLLVGVYRFSLVDIGSGANCVHFLPLTVEGYSSDSDASGEQASRLPNNLVEVFAHYEVEVRLLVEAAKKLYPRLSELSTTMIMATLTKWYDGYSFGGTDGKFNPYAVAMFLNKLKSSNMKSAAKDYWRDTGNHHAIEDLVIQNWSEFTWLTPRLMLDYDHNHDGHDNPDEPNDRDEHYNRPTCSVYIAGQQSQDPILSSQEDTVRVWLCDESLPRNGGPQYDLSQIITMLIHTGYLTIGAGGEVRIPNGELRNMWESLRLVASFKTRDSVAQDRERIRLHKELYSGNIRNIFDSFQSAHANLSNAANNYPENVLADIVRSHVIGKLDQPRFLQSDGSISNNDFLNQPDYVTEQESGHGKPDWVVKLPVTRENPQPFILIFEFKRVTSPSNDNANGPLRLARAGLEQIVNKEYARPFGNYARRLDIGVAIGKGKVAMRQRLWTRVEGTLAAPSDGMRDGRNPLKRSSETVEEWDQRLVNADDAGWQDGLGWQTQRLESNYRQ